MCGRFSLFADDDELVSLFDIDLLEGEHAATWNQAPSQQIRVVVERAAAPSDSEGAGSANQGPPSSPTIERKLRLLEWGLVPSWAKTPRPMINARMETLTEKPSFRAAAARRRCLVPANGYFEWQVVEGSRTKQPWFLSQGPGDPVLAFAGIYEAWKEPGSEPGEGWLLTCAIVTRSASDALGRIHDRTPVVVPPDLWDAWLDPAVTDRDQVDTLLASIPEPHLATRMVGRAVGNVRADGPQLIEAVEPS